MGFLCSVVDGSFNGRTSLFKLLLIPKTSKQIKQNKQTSKQTIKQPPPKNNPPNKQSNKHKERNKQMTERTNNKQTEIKSKVKTNPIIVTRWATQLRICYHNIIAVKMSLAIMLSTFLYYQWKR
jgi:hypothetical protein